MNAKCSLFARVFFALACVVSFSFADTRYPVAAATAKTNRSRIEVFRKDAYWKGAPFAVAAVDAVCGIRRTPDLFPEDGDFTNGIAVIAAQDEYESASVMLYGFSDVADVLLVPGDLKGPGGRIHASEFDPKVVKVWYQQGSAWGSFFSDPLRRIPTPELLLHDEALIEVDHEGRENFLRYDYSSGTRYRWISFGAAAVDHSKEGFVNPRRIHDAEKLRPFSLQKDEFKQLFIAIHVPAGQKPGLYTGSFAVTIAGKKACEIPVRLRVLPFTLPQPATFRDLSRRYRCTPYSYGNPATTEKLTRNMVRHGVANGLLNPIRNEDDARAALEMFKKTGFDTEHLFHALPRCGVTTSYPPQENDANFERYHEVTGIVTRSMAAIRKVFGPGTKAYSYGVDEGGPNIVRGERAVWEAVHRAGASTMVATRWHNYILFNLDYANVPRPPRTAKRIEAEAFHAANPDALIGWYADPHSGPENPDYARRVYGLQTWRNNYDGSCQYILYRNNWNDFWVPDESNLRGLMLVYPQDGDVLDTIEWEGLREGMDDVRYATLLKQLGEQARLSSDLSIHYAGRAALAWISQVDCEHSSLDYLRMESIRRILDLQSRLAKEGK
jgi:hypothetical protein